MPMHGDFPLFFCSSIFRRRILVPPHLSLMSTFGLDNLSSSGLSFKEGSSTAPQTWERDRDLRFSNKCRWHMIHLMA